VYPWRNFLNVAALDACKAAASRCFPVCPRGLFTNSVTMRWKYPASGTAHRIGNRARRVARAARPGRAVRIKLKAVTAPYFLGTKIEAFRGRGHAARRRRFPCARSGECHQRAAERWRGPNGACRLWLHRATLCGRAAASFRQREVLGFQPKLGEHILHGIPWPPRWANHACPSWKRRRSSSVTGSSGPFTMTSSK